MSDALERTSAGDKGATFTIPPAESVNRQRTVGNDKTTKLQTLQDIDEAVPT